MLVPFYIKFFRRDQKQCRNSQVCQVLVEPDKLNIKRNLQVASMEYCKGRESKRNEKQMQFCLILLTSQIHYDVIR